MHQQYEEEGGNEESYEEEKEETNKKKHNRKHIKKQEEKEEGKTRTHGQQIEEKIIRIKLHEKCKASSIFQCCFDFYQYSELVRFART